MKTKSNQKSVDESEKKKDDIVHLARLALAGRPQDIQTYIRRL